MLDLDRLTKAIQNTRVASGEHLELEAKFKVDNIMYVQRVREYLQNKGVEYTIESSTVNYYKNDIREVITEDDTVYEFKKKIEHNTQYLSLYGFSITLSKEARVNTKPEGDR